MKINIKKIMPNIKKDLIKDLIDLNIRPVLVGGLVRDFLINPNIISKDIDIEMYSSKSYEEIVSKLQQKGYKCSIVGKQFGVIKVSLDDIEIDLSLPRTEKSIGNKHTDFNIEIDGNLSFKEAFKRRDFTFNAIGYDLIDNKFINLYNGIEDLNNKEIKHVNAKTFLEDPLRIYRAIQFAARFDFKIANRTKLLIKVMINRGMLDDLPKERVFTEFEKLLLKSKNPSIGFELMKDFGILEKYFPELYDLINVPQDKKWHPEGDVWTHTMLVIDEMAKMEVDNSKKLLYMFSCLCHDLGKPSTTKILEDGKITSQNHEELGVEPTKKFLEKLTNNKKLIEQVCCLVELHLKPSLYYQSKCKNSTINKLNNNLIDIGLELKDLLIINKADYLGRTTLDAINKIVPQYDWFLNKIEELKIKNEKIKPLVTGNDLISLGYKPDKNFKDILNNCYEYQLENEILNKQDILDVFLNNELTR